MCNNLCFMICHKCVKNLDESLFHKSNTSRGRAFYCKNCRKQEWLDKKEKAAFHKYKIPCEGCCSYKKLYDGLCQKCMDILQLRHCKKCDKVKLTLEFYQRKRVCRTCLLQRIP